jgi:hypothetical protein
MTRRDHTVAAGFVYLEMSMSEELKERISVDLGGEHPTEIFMSYNRVRLCVAAMDNEPSNIELVLIDPELSDKLVSNALATKRDGTAATFEPFDLNSVELTMSTYNDVLAWAVAHCADFFVKRLEGVADLVKGNQPKIQALSDFVSGSKASSGSDQSAGPSE